MKSVQIRSYFWSVFSSIRAEYGDHDTFLVINCVVKTAVTS